MTFSTPARFLAAAAIVALAGCGGGSAAKSASNVAAAASAAPGAMATTEAQRESAALPSGTVAAVPKDLNCGAVKPVWVNLKKKSYHTSDDPYYGKTKNGKYECAAQAVTDGYHAAGAGHKGHHKGGAMSSGTSAPDGDTDSDTSTP